MMDSTLVAAYIAASTAFSLPPGLLSAICYVESGHTANIISIQDGRSDSLGICQIKETTAAQVGFKGYRERLVLNPSLNVFVAGAYLRYQLDRYHQSVYKAVGAFNAGSFCDGLNTKYIDKVFKAWNDGK